jgi:hypothetical protein
MQSILFYYLIKKKLVFLVKSVSRKIKKKAFLVKLVQANKTIAIWRKEPAEDPSI